MAGENDTFLLTRPDFEMTSDSAVSYTHLAPNLLNQTFTPTAPNQVWVADLTYVATQEGWLYLAAVSYTHLDVYKRQPVL